jgi:phosphoglycerol transferase MdoB-like AlkP superfamily enzyme
MFLHIQTLLAEAEAAKQPVLVFALSTTFHPPYRVPDGYSAPAFALTEQQSKRFEQLAATGGDGGIDNVFGTFRYTTDKLGDFMSWLKASPYATHSIVAITGDHDTRSIGYPTPEEAVLADAVPFYLYIPSAYRVFAHYDPLTTGSHKDIWPTIYNLSLANTRYYKTGCDLLAEDKTACFSYGNGIITDKGGAFAGGQHWQWQEPDNPANLLLGAPESIEASGMGELYKRYSAYMPMLTWQTNRQVNEGK